MANEVATNRQADPPISARGDPAKSAAESGLKMNALVPQFMPFHG